MWVPGLLKFLEESTLGSGTCEKFWVRNGGRVGTVRTVSLNPVSLDLAVRTPSTRYIHARYATFTPVIRRCELSTMPQPLVAKRKNVRVATRWCLCSLKTNQVLAPERISPFSNVCRILRRQGDEDNFDRQRSQVLRCSTRPPAAEVICMRQCSTCH